MRTEEERKLLIDSLSDHGAEKDPSSGIVADNEACDPSHTPSFTKHIVIDDVRVQLGDVLERPSVPFLSDIALPICVSFLRPDGGTLGTSSQEWKKERECGSDKRIYRRETDESIFNLRMQELQVHKAAKQIVYFDA